MAVTRFCEILIPIPDLRNATITFESHSGL